MGITRIERRRLSDGVVEQLMGLITDGTLARGDKLPSERELARSLGVSRPLVRESFRTLESMGLVQVKRGVGTIVTRTSPAQTETNSESLSGYTQNGARQHQDSNLAISQLERTTILDILEAREALEVQIVALASHRITPEEIGWLRDAASRTDTWNDNREFHTILASVSHNFMLERLVAQLLDLLRDAHQREHYASQVNTKSLLSEHHDIAEAVIAGNVEIAQGLVRNHFKHTRQIIVWNNAESSK